MLFIISSVHVAFGMTNEKAYQQSAESIDPPPGENEPDGNGKPDWSKFRAPDAKMTLRHVHIIEHQIDVLFEMWRKDNGKPPPALPKWIDMCHKFGKAFIDELYSFQGEDEYEDLCFRRCMEFKEFRKSCHMVSPRSNQAIQNKDGDYFCQAFWEVSQKRAWDLKSPGVDENPYKDDVAAGGGDDDSHRDNYHKQYKANEGRWDRQSVWHKGGDTQRDGTRANTWASDQERERGGASTRTAGMLVLAISVVK